MRLIASAFVTVDGVMEAPGFDEHRGGRNAWALRVQDEETPEVEVNLEPIRVLNSPFATHLTYRVVTQLG